VRLRAGCNRQLAVLATGLGKAVLFAMLRKHHEFTKRVMVLVHREELASQAGDKIYRWNRGLMIGVEMAERRARPMDSFIVASVPTLGRAHSPRLQKFDPAEFDAIVSDEAHHSTSPQWRRVLDHFGLMKPDPAAPLSLGLTATPNRSDGTGLRECFDEIVFTMGIQEGVQTGYLADLRGFRVSTKTSLDKVHSRAGDFAENELADAVNNPERNALVVKEWAKHAWDKKSIVFTVDIQHALDLAEAFRVHNVASAAVWGDDPERSLKLAQHRAGALRVLCNCAVLTEGYDDWAVECIVLAKPTKSQLLFTQMIGRGTRIPDGVDNILSHDGPLEKTDCLILDVVDSTTKHSLVTLPSLLGLPAELDMKGQKFTKAKEQIERVAQEFPTANLQEIRNLDELKSIAENVALFHVSYPPEVSQLSELAWRKSGDGYMLPVNRDIVTIARDLRDEWWVRGAVNGKQIEESSQNLPGCFNIADKLIVNNGGVPRLLQRDATWRANSPTDKQVALCRKLHIAIPQGATRGMVSAALDAKLRRVIPQQEVAYHGEF
jgi:superfamily II DNA or RNA helicase